MNNIVSHQNFQSVDITSQSSSRYSYQYNTSSQRVAPSAPINEEYLGPPAHIPYHGFTPTDSSSIPVSQAWTVPIPQDGFPSEPPPPYSVCDNNFYVPKTETAITTCASVTTSGDMKPFKIKQEYLLTELAAIKILEFVVCLIGFSTCASFRNSFTLELDYGDRTSVFTFLLIACWLFAGMVFCFNLLGFLDRFNEKIINAKKMIVVHCSISFLLLIASSMLTSMHVCLIKVAGCSTYNAAVACGFFAMALFIIDTSVQYRNYKNR